MKDAVLILGAAGVQIPLIEFVQSKGYRAIVVSIPGNYPGFAIADKCIYCDVRDADSIMREIADERVVAVITDQTDLPVPTVAELSHRLGLAGNEIRTAITYTNKYFMREAVGEAGLPNIKYYRSSHFDDVVRNWHIYPAIVKPEDNQGSRGVSYVKDASEMEKAFEEALTFSKTGNVIIEEFFEGTEVVAEGFVVNGEYLNFGIGDRKYFHLDNQFIPSQTIFPSNLPDEVQNKVLSYEQKLHAFLHPSFGMIHSEYLVNEKGDVRLVETALRGGGVYISSHLVPLYTGINNYEVLLHCSLGKPTLISDLRKRVQRKASAYVCFYLPEGDIASVNGLEKLLQMKGVVKIDMGHIEIGNHVSPMTNKTHRLGPILVAADNRRDVDQLIKQVQTTLDIRVKCNDGSIKPIIWN